MTNMLGLLRVSGAAAICLGFGLSGQGQPPETTRSPTARVSGPGEMLPPPPPIRLLEIEGTPKDRGVAHGKALRREIREILGLFRKDLAARFEMPADEFITRFRLETDFESAALKWTPKLIQELHGIAEGAEVDYDTLFVFQLIDEIWAQGKSVVGDPEETPGARRPGGSQPSGAGAKRAGDKCTSLGVDRTGGAPTLVAQNLDVPRFFHGYRTVIHIKEGKGKTRLQTFVVTVPGLLAMNGMNDQGVGVAVNTMLQLRPCRDGLPVAFVVRGLLERRNFHDARKFLFTIRHASGQNYLLGGRDVAHSFECSSQRVVRFITPSPGKRVWHTNHPLVNENWAPGFRAGAQAAGVEPRDHLRECPRFAALTARFGSVPAPTAADLILALRDRLGQKEGVSNSLTFVSTLMKLGHDQQLQVAPGAPDQASHVVYRFPEERKMRKSEK